MMDNPTDSMTLDIGHVLFMDIVGFSLLKIDEQPRVLSELEHHVRQTETFERFEHSDRMISLPTGDGMALVFFGDALAPIQCATELDSIIQKIPHIHLRMGVHSGPVYQVRDINDNWNVSGAGMNMAQRVMDAGDEGHILVSSTVADVLLQLTSWETRLHDLGSVEVKHGVHVHLYNLYDLKHGNPVLPEKLHAANHAPPESYAETIERVRRARAGGAEMDAADPEQAVSDDAAQIHADGAAAGDMGSELSRPTPAPSPKGQVVKPENGRQVSILYRRHAATDERLMHLLETQLVSAGYRVFIDRHMTVGMRWAQEIEKQIRSSYAVVALLSEQSIYSEMMAMEIKIAYEAAQEQGGEPHLLPVRIRYEGPIPDEIAQVLDPIQYFLWTNSDDDTALIQQITATLEQPTTARQTDTSQARPPVSPSTTVAPAGGAMAPDSPLYIPRVTDTLFLDAVARGDSIVLIKGARQMGKTSLLARGIQYARTNGRRVVLTDMQKLNATQLASPQALFMALGDMLADQLGMDTYPEDVWRERRGASTNFERYLRRYVLGDSETPLLWAMDEVDRLFTCESASEVFGLFRSWHNERSLDPMGPWRRLTMAIAYATEAHLFITDINQSPFNVGMRIELHDFTFDEVTELNRRCGNPLPSESERRRLMRLVGGYPFLTHRALQEIATYEMSITDFEWAADRDDGIFGDHLRRILVFLANDDALADAVRSVLRGEPAPSASLFYRLRAAGVIVGNSPRDARPRCQLYANYLERHLL